MFNGVPFQHKYLKMEVDSFISVLGLTGEGLVHLSILGFRSFSFPAGAFLPVPSTITGNLTICKGLLIIN